MVRTTGIGALALGLGLAACSAPLEVADTDKSPNWLGELYDWEPDMSFTISTRVVAAPLCDSVECAPRLELVGFTSKWETTVEQAGATTQTELLLPAPIELSASELRALSYRIIDDGNQGVVLAEGTFRPSIEAPGQMVSDDPAHGVILSAFTTHQTLPIAVRADCVVGQLTITKGTEQSEVNLALGETWSGDLHIGDRIETEHGDTYFIGPFASEFELGPLECEWNVEVTSASGLQHADQVLELERVDSLRKEWTPELQSAPVSNGGVADWGAPITLARNLRASNIWRLSFRIHDAADASYSGERDRCDYTPSGGDDFSEAPITVTCTSGTELTIRFTAPQPEAPADQEE